MTEHPKTPGSQGTYVLLHQQSTIELPQGRMDFDYWP